MKKCPFCGAIIEENARICLYCMKELNNKINVKPLTVTWWKKHSASLTVCSLAIILSICFLIWFIQHNKQTATPTDSKISENTSSSESQNINQETPSKEPLNNSDYSTSLPDTVIPDSDPLEQNPVDTPQTNQSEATPPKDNSENTLQDIPETNPSEPTASENITDGLTYLYRDAEKVIDDYYTGANVEGCIVITGVESFATDGIYRIPSTIDGKKVITIDKSAFNAPEIKETVKEIYIPQSIRTVKEFAFSGCINLTDVYLYGESIHIDSQAFTPPERRNGSLTIHCSYNCDNRDMRYYRNIAEGYYDAIYEEWNG